MNFLNPLGALIAAGITVPLLVALYFLKLRRKPLKVPSTLLWQRAVQDLQVNAPWQRIRNSLLLWVQLLLLLLLLIVWARPTREAAVTTGERVVLVIDRSASMNAADGPGGQTRLDQAKAAALELIDGLSGSAGAMVVSFAQRAATVQALTSDKGLLRRAIGDVRASDQRSGLEPALAVAQQLVAAGGDAADAGVPGLEVYVFSDGRVHREGSETPALPGATLSFVRMGRADTANLGLVQCSARRDPEDPGKVRVFAALSNSGSQGASVNLTLTRDGQVAQTRAVTVPGAAAGGGAVGEVGVTFELRIEGGAEIEVFHDRPDVLAADDRARLVVLPARRLRVLLVSPGGASQVYVQQALAAAGALAVRPVAPAVFEAMDPAQLREGGGAAGDEGFDIVVFDRYTPRAEPQVASLSFAAAPPVAGLKVVPAAEQDTGGPLERVLTWKRDHPLMNYVVLDDVALRRPGRLVVPPAATVLAVGAGGPLMAEVRGPTGLRHVSVSFGVLESRWPHHWSFQVFMVNALETLGLSEQVGAGEAALAYRTGESAAVPAPGGTEGEGQAVRYVGTGAAAGSAVSGTVRQGRAALSAFERVGTYQAADSGARGGYDRLAVNLLDPLESDLRAADTLDVAASAPVTVATAGGALARQELWAWFAWAALAVLLIEGWLYTRRMRV